MVGIETLKQVIIWNSNLINEISELVERAKNKKRKISGWAALGFIDNLVQGVMLGSKYQDIALEWKDLDDVEKVELKNLIKKELNVEDEFTEEVAERIFYLVMEIGDTVTFILSKSQIKRG